MVIVSISGAKEEVSHSSIKIEKAHVGLEVRDGLLGLTSTGSFHPDECCPLSSYVKFVTLLNLSQTK